MIISLGCSFLQEKTEINKKLANIEVEINENRDNIIKNNNAKDWCKVISFNDRALFRIHKLDKEIRLGKLFVGKHAHLPLSFDKGVNLKPLHRYHFVDEIIVKHTHATQAIIDRVHEMGKELHVWTVNDMETIETLVERGVDGIISDYPNLLMKYKR